MLHETIVLHLIKFETSNKLYLENVELQTEVNGSQGNI